MVKRFTDTNIWDKNWYSDLNCKLKCLVKYIFDKADSIGIWECNLKIASAYIGEKITEEDLNLLGHLISKIDENKYLINDFISFQYGKLSEDCPAHKPIFKLISKYSFKLNDTKDSILNTLSYTLSDRLPNSLQEKEKEEEEEKEKEIEVLGKCENPFKEIIDYLNYKTHKHYKPTSEITKKLIKIKLNQGFTLEDFKRVIDNKCSEWLNNPDFEKFLRPETLFGSKFEGYLNERINPMKGIIANKTLKNAKVFERFINSDAGKSQVEKCLNEIEGELIC